MLWGHRNDPVNFHRCLQDFDRRLPDLLDALRDGDLLIITSDHGCDPTTPSTDHSREHALLLAYVHGRNAAGRIHEDGRVRGRRRDGERLARAARSRAEASPGRRSSSRERDRPLSRRRPRRGRPLLRRPARLPRGALVRPGDDRRTRRARALAERARQLRPEPGRRRPGWLEPRSCSRFPSSTRRVAGLARDGERVDGPAGSWCVVARSLGQSRSSCSRRDDQAGRADRAQARRRRAVRRGVERADARPTRATRSPTTSWRRSRWRSSSAA